MINVTLKSIGRDDEGNLICPTTRMWLRDTDATGYAPLKPGEVVAVSDEEGTWLLKNRRDHIEVTLDEPNRESPPGDPYLGEAPEPKAKPKVDNDVPTIAVINVIRELSEDDEDLWTPTGKPKIEVIRNVLGQGVTTEQRDSAWAELQAVSEPTGD